METTLNIVLFAGTVTVSLVLGLLSLKIIVKARTYLISFNSQNKIKIAIKNIKRMSIHGSFDYKFGLITYHIFRDDEVFYSVTDTSSGWTEIDNVDQERLILFIKGDIEFYEI